MAEIKIHTAGPEYSFDQSHHEHVPSLPTRMLIVAPSGAGKTVLLASLVHDIFVTKGGKSAFSRIFIWSPTVNLDATWRSVKNFQHGQMRVPEEEKDDLYHEEFDEAQLRRVVMRQHAVTELAKKRGLKRLHQILIILDDVADSPEIVRGSKTLHSLFTRGRHAGISTICSLQSYRAVHPIIRKNATALVVFRLRSVAEKQAIVEENSAVYSKDVVEEIYEAATEAPHSFLYVNFLAKKREDLFWEGFTQRLIPASEGSKK